MGKICEKIFKYLTLCEKYQLICGVMQNAKFDKYIYDINKKCIIYF
jgi:hypothetical protein